MSDETCDDCGRAFAKTLNQYRDGLLCGRELTPGYEEAQSCDRERNCFAYGLGRTKDKLSATERERDEWREKFEQQARLNCTLVEQNCVLIRRNTELGDGAYAGSERKVARLEAELQQATQALSVADAIRLNTRNGRTSFPEAAAVYWEVYDAERAKMGTKTDA